MSRSSLAGRALVALALMIGFYLLAIAVAALLLYIPYAEIVYAETIHIKLLLGCIIGALVILWSIVPRFDKFEAPGPELTEAEQPRLFAAIRDIAAATGQSMPAEVYAVGDVNAWVMQRGGLLGIGSRRVMGLGLPLLHELSIDEFRAVLAHEFGHYHGGDTKLGGFVYKTRASIFRTVENLASGNGILHKPFEAYAKLFLRVTESISRQQELAADQLAARVVGASALASGLIAVNRGGAAFSGYWRNEVAPVLSAGYRPPVAAGYAMFISVSEVANSLDAYISKRLEDETVDPYDSHPPLATRLAALKTLGVAVRRDSLQLRAASLLTNADDVEARLLAMITNANELGELKSIEWRDVGQKVWLGQWKKQARAFERDLAGLTAGALSGFAGKLTSFGSDPELARLSVQERTNFAASTIGCGLAVALAQAGWSVEALPGAAVIFRRGEDALEPFRFVTELADGKLEADAWQQLCARTGISDLSIRPA